nr:unnamed protein product [Callosobruchus chinensis]
MEQYGRSKVALPYSPTHCEDTLLKPLEFIFSKSQAEVYVYKRDKISRRKTDAGQTQRSRFGQNKGKQSRREAVIVKSNGRSYADLVREFRKDVNLNTVDVEVSKIRKIQKGDLLLEVRKGKAEDLETTKEDIISALKDTLADDVARCRVISIRPAYGESQNATVIADIDVARLLLKKGTLLVGLIHCPVKERDITGWCHRCWEMGHDRTKCQGPNRADLCFKYAKSGHATKDCANDPYCPLCNKPGHRMGKTGCVGST